MALAIHERVAFAGRVKIACAPGATGNDADVPPDVGMAAVVVALTHTTFGPILVNMHWIGPPGVVPEAAGSVSDAADVPTVSAAVTVFGEKGIMLSSNYWNAARVAAHDKLWSG